MAAIGASAAGIRFLFDRQGDVVTPLRSRLALRRTETWGLRDVSFRIDPGEGVALIGASGSGKTSLLRALAGVLPVDEGEIRVHGRVASMLSTDAGLLPALTGRENALLLAVLGGMSRAAARARLKAIRERSGLGEAFDRPASSYSQGMLARLAFAAATEGDPEVLLLDEVHEAFDHPFREVLDGLAHDVLARGGIAVAAGHDHEILSRLCRRGLLLEHGRVVADGPFGEVRSRYLGAQAPREVEGAAR